MTTPLKKSARRKNLPLFLSLCLPMLIFGICLAFHDMFPFGDGQIMASDGWHQYYPFLLVFRNKLLTGGSLQYTWNFGAGTSFASLFAYYLASPMYLLSALVPLSLMREFFAFVTVLKVGLAGLFFCIFLRTVYKKNDLPTVFFALMYALCAWAAGYYWNIMWLDVFALLPLLIAGTVALLRDGRFRLYVVALALSLWCNYYIAFFCCIFVAICFVGVCLVTWNGWGNFLRRFVRIGLCTLLGVGIAAVIWVPTILAMQHTYSAAATEVMPFSLNIAEGANGFTTEGQGLWSLLKTETLPGAWDAARQVFSTLLTGQEVTWYTGLPNLFCSFTAIILAVYFFCCKKIKLREKLFYAFVVLLFLVSIISKKLDYYWHGMHFPNCLPYRYSFLLSFVLITMAYRGFTQLDGLKKRHCFIAMGVSGLLLVNAFLPDFKQTAAELWSLLKGTRLLTLMSSPAPRMLLLAPLVWVGVGISLFLYRPSGKRKTIALCLLSLIIVCEMTVSIASGVDEIGTTGRDSYLWQQDNVNALKDFAAKQENELFYRSEMTGTYTLDEGALYDFNGVSTFTSSANVNFNRFSRSLGLHASAAGNRFSYYEGTPFGNTLCSVKYLFDRLNQHRNTDYNEELASSGNTKLLRVNSYIGLGFMTNSALSDYVSAGLEKGRIDGLQEQQKIFSLATGIDTELYTPLGEPELSAEGDTAFYKNGERFYYSTSNGVKETYLYATYPITESGLYCLSARCATGKEVSVTVNEEVLFARAINSGATFSIGNLKAGDELVLKVYIKNGTGGSVHLTVAKQNNAVFDEGFAGLADEPFVITDFSDTEVCGTITAKQDGFFYTSIPYEPGWTAFVDGKEVLLAETFDSSAEDVKLTDAVISFPLSAGTHEITLRYRTPGLLLGIGISVAALVVFLVLCILLRKRLVLLPDKMAAKEAELPIEGELPDKVAAEETELPLEGDCDLSETEEMQAPAEEEYPLVDEFLTVQDTPTDDVPLPDEKK